MNCQCEAYSCEIEKLTVHGNRIVCNCVFSWRADWRLGVTGHQGVCEDAPIAAQVVACNGLDKVAF